MPTPAPARKPSEEKAAPAGAGAIAAAPSVRRLARELGVDLADVAGTGDAGRILTEDVRAHAEAGSEEPTAPPAPAGKNASGLCWFRTRTAPCRPG